MNMVIKISCLLSILCIYISNVFCGSQPGTDDGYLVLPTHLVSPSSASWLNNEEPRQDLGGMV